MKEGSIPKNSKDEAYWKVLSHAIELDIKKGHLKWTLSDLSRQSGITRSLIYYYFGRSKVDIIRAAVKLIGEDLCGLSEERRKMWEDGRFAESMLMARQLYDRMPYIGSFILEHRHRPTDIGAALREIEKEFLNKIKGYFKCQNEGEIKTIFSIYWGLSFAPLVDRDVIQRVMGILKKSISS